ncbi:hypothetical protein FRC17_006280 [Serendipita sp. 399]|nr:hypothetical protein FRC17_006280 [Serendipita sp. 399]
MPTNPYTTVRINANPVTMPNATAPGTQTRIRTSLQPYDPHGEMKNYAIPMDPPHRLKEAPRAANRTRPAVTLTRGSGVEERPVRTITNPATLDKTRRTINARELGGEAQMSGDTLYDTW